MLEIRNWEILKRKPCVISYCGTIVTCVEAHVTDSGNYIAQFGDSLFGNDKYMLLVNIYKSGIVRLTLFDEATKETIKYETDTLKVDFSSPCMFCNSLNDMVYAYMKST